MIDTMKQALEYTRPGAIVPVTPETVKILVDALRLAIEQAERQEPVCEYCGGDRFTAPPQQEKAEPVAMRYDFDGYGYKYIDAGSGSNWQTRHKGAEPLYEAPPQQEKQAPVAWQGLTREETVSLARQHLGGMPIGREFVDAVEALLREKNTAPPQQKKQEPVAWKNAALRIGEELSTVGPDGYYDMTAEQWLSWAMDQRPTGKQSLQVEPVAWADLLKEAEQIVRSKTLWKRFIDGTPLSNDIAVWMADFAQKYRR